MCEAAPFSLSEETPKARRNTRATREVWAFYATAVGKAWQSACVFSVAVSASTPRKII